MNITIRGASYTDVTTITIDIGHDNENNYINDGKELFNILCDTLPSETWDELMKLMLIELYRDYVK